MQEISHVDNDPIYKGLVLRRQSAIDYGELEDYVVYAHFNGESLDISDNKSEQAADGILFVLLSHGSLHMSANSANFEMQGASLVIKTPRKFFSLSCKSSDNADVHLLYLSSKAIQDINLSISTVALSDSQSIQHRTRLDLPLNEKSQRQLLRYLKIINTAIDDDFNKTLSRHIISSAFSSMLYQSVVYYFKNVGVELTERAPTRRTTYVRDFFKLVHLNYTMERSVIFYADKLCVSPKYLSMLVKETTGRSAAAWIDDIVIMEAKNLLRFSGKNVQQVAYALNFVNQSAFGKYFKHLTGMSPTEFQRKG